MFLIGGFVGSTPFGGEVREQGREEPVVIPSSSSARRNLSYGAGYGMQLFDILAR